MKKNIETKKDGKEFERFDDILRQVIKAPKEKILEREKAEKERKAEERRKAKG